MSNAVTSTNSRLRFTGSHSMPHGYKWTEAGIVPQDWEESTVGKEFRMQLGKMLDSAKNIGVSKPYLGNRAVQWGTVDIDKLATVPMTSSDLHRFRLRSGDLLVCEGGEIGRAAIWDEQVPECYYQKAIHRLRSIRGYDAYLMMSYLRMWTQTGFLTNYVTQTSIAHLPKDKFTLVPLSVPPPDEQRAIAEALSDADRLIGSLTKLITKKRAIKQATMQQLLTAKTRLPGFSREWVPKRLDDLGPFSKGRGIRRNEVSDEGISCIRYGELYTRYFNYVFAPISRISAAVAQTSLSIKTGDLLFAGSGETAEEIGRCAAYLGTEPAYAGGDIVVLSPHGQNSMYLGHLMNHPSVASQKARFGQGDAVVHINARNLAQIEIDLPHVDEQSAIALVLSTMDTEIRALDRRLTKTKHIKQGMMQQLLTGCIRLVEQQVAESKAEVVEETKGTKPHSWAFNEAVVISMLTKHFGSEQYPLGRKRYTKYSYLLHRHAEKKAEGYLKKAAGPYNPSTKYGGPEKIAVENGYISKQKSGKFQGFVAACSIDKAEEYFEKWYGSDAMQWLEQFRYKKNDELEVLATVDMAAEDLRTSGKAVDVESVKKVIANHPEWKAKLDRSAFSDTNISEAIKAVSELFGGEVHA